MKIKLMKITAAFCVFLAAAGFVLLLGSLGAMDRNNVSITQGFIQCLVGIGATVGGGMFARLLFNEIEYRERKKILEEAIKEFLEEIEDDYEVKD